MVTIEQQGLGEVEVFPKQGMWSLTNSLLDLAKKYCPDKVKDELKGVIQGENPRYPLSEPVRIDCLGCMAKFWVKSRTDWYRILSRQEQAYGQRLYQCLNEMPKGVFWDIGSAQGRYAIPAALMGWETYAIDPDPVAQAALQKNLALNPKAREKMSVLQAAAGRERGVLPLYVSDQDRWAPSLHKNDKRLSNRIEVAVVSLGEMVDQGLIKPPDIVKIDVEGAEMMALWGMETIRPTNWFIEIHDKYLPKFGASREQLIKHLLAKGYRLTQGWDNGAHCHFEI